MAISPLNFVRTIGVRSLVCEKVFQKLRKKIRNEASIFSSFECEPSSEWPWFVLKKDEYHLYCGIDGSHRTIYGISDIRDKQEALDEIESKKRIEIKEADFREINNVKNLLNKAELEELVKKWPTSSLS